VIIEAGDTELAVGATLQLTATAYDDDGDEITGRDVEWSVSNNSIATIDDNGLLTGVAAGAVSVTAEIGGKTDSQAFSVVNPFGTCPVANHTFGTTTTATLATGDCRLSDQTFVDLYRFTITTRRTVTITMRSSAVDSYLFLVTAVGDDIAEDDDSAGGTDARISVTLDPGTYVIGANSFLPASGQYTLTTQ
jgi:serine protease Do